MSTPTIDGTFEESERIKPPHIDDMPSGAAPSEEDVAAAKAREAETRLEEAALAIDEGRYMDVFAVEVITAKYLKGKFIYIANVGWKQWTGKVWAACDESVVCEAMRVAAGKFWVDQLTSRQVGGGLRDLVKLMTATKIRNFTTLARGILIEELANLDAHPHLLNVGNGIVNMRANPPLLIDHDPKYLLTKLTEVPYIAGAEHEYWFKALEALPEDRRDWMQIRFGQAITGFVPPDDIVPVLWGGGSNGKSTIINGIDYAGGDHVVMLSEKVLLASDKSHPTEMMDLLGARTGFLEELPEGARLNAKRLKATSGTAKITARLMRQDTVTFEATHSMMITTNFLPKVSETDTGTWRRLALVVFPYHYVAEGKPLEAENDRQGDDKVRNAMKEGGFGVHEAVLAWLVEGANRWFQDDMVMPLPPQSVVDDTAAWRGSDDHILGFFNDRLIADPKSHVMVKELYKSFEAWAEESNYDTWNGTEFKDKFEGHEIVNKLRIKHGRKRDTQEGLSRGMTLWGVAATPPPKQFWAWIGVRFRTAEDPEVGDLGEE